jgi:hypothetical protein
MLSKAIATERLDHGERIPRAETQPMSDSQGPIGYDEAHRHANTVFRRDLWDAAESALEAVTPALWDMALAAGALLDVKPDVKRPHPRRALRKPQVEGEVAVVLRIEGRTDALPVTIGDLHCRVGRQWSFPPRWLRRTRLPVWKDLASYDLQELSTAPLYLIEDLRAVVASGIRTRRR